MKIPYTKMHGIGNDYIYLNCLGSTPNNLPSLAQEMSHRHFGIGSDGLVLILPSDKADFRMQMFNSDGSEAEMCGNAIRCVGKYVYEKNLTNNKNLNIETKAGIKTLELIVNADNIVNLVKVDLGEPILKPNLVPVNLEGDSIINYPYDFFGETFNISCISMGNPHVIIFVPEINDKQVLELGPKIETHEIFPNKINVEFVKIVNSNEIEMRVWERGAGETFACGTGAGAVAVAAVLNNLAERKVLIHLLGGDLEIEWAENNHVYKTGPATFVSDGEYYTQLY